MSRGYIYKLLSNPIYIGRIAHKGETYDGLHPGIIGQGLWDAVQATLADNTPIRSNRNRATDPSSLMGMLFDETGAMLSPSHAVKSGRRYRYYVSRRLVDGIAAQAIDAPAWRLPAREIERNIRDIVLELMNNPGNLAKIVRAQGMESSEIEMLFKMITRWKGAPLDLVERVDLSNDGLTLFLDLSAFADVPLRISHAVATTIKRRGVEMRMVIDGPAVNATADRFLIKAIVKAATWFDDLAAGRATSVAEIANVEGVTNRYIGRLLPLAFLSPDIVEAIFDGRQPPELTTTALVKRTELPLRWSDQ